VDWPVGVGGKGNEGVAALVLQTSNSIGYVSTPTRWEQDRLRPGAEQGGQVREAGCGELQAAAAGADWTQAQDFSLVTTDSPAHDAYPIAATAFILMRKDSGSPTRTTTALGFFRWALENGQKQAAELDYVALPPSLVGQIEAYWKNAFSGTN
jgi:phosphate transport system substrate-binding protein